MGTLEQGTAPCLATLRPSALGPQSAATSRLMQLIPCPTKLHPTLALTSHGQLSRINGLLARHRSRLLALTPAIAEGRSWSCTRLYKGRIQPRMPGTEHATASINMALGALTMKATATCGVLLTMFLFPADSWARGGISDLKHACPQYENYVRSAQ